MSDIKDIRNKELPVSLVNYFYFYFISSFANSRSHTSFTFLKLKLRNDKVILRDNVNAF